MRADAGFWKYSVIDMLTRLGMAGRSRFASNPGIRTAIEGTDESTRTTIACPDGGEAHAAECGYVTGQGRHRHELCLVVRSTRLTDAARRRLWPEWSEAQKHSATVGGLSTA